MIFQKISYRIALQFTAFVLGLLLLNGTLFLAADFSNARHEEHMRLRATAQFVLEQMRGPPGSLPRVLPPVIRDRVRIVDPLGGTIYAGAFFEEIPFAFNPRKDMEGIAINDQEFIVLTTPILLNGTRAGFIQIADLERIGTAMLPLRALIYLLLSLTISALTFLVGLLFARTSLKPAEEMVERLEQFTQDASHELRTPIAALSSSLDLALKTRNYQEGIVSAKEDLKEVASLVERLLDLARLDRLVLKKDPVDFSTLITTVVERHRALAKDKGVSLTESVAPAITVRGDAQLLKQIIGNLLSNAIKFTPVGGEIAVTLTVDALIVRDTGIGIPPGALPKIFERFYQAEDSRSKGGYGLGLSLVKRIADLHAWSIEVQSKPKNGTTFAVYFRKKSKRKTS